MQTVDFESSLEKVMERDSRFRRDAYVFLREALDYTQRCAAKSNKDQIRHVTGQELLEGVRFYALEQFGPMAMLVLNDWGVHRCEDVGDMVFNLIEVGLFGKTETDSRDDFKGGYEFSEAFRKPFIPEEKARQNSRLQIPRPKEIPSTK